MPEKNIILQITESNTFIKLLEVASFIVFCGMIAVFAAGIALSAPVFGVIGLELALVALLGFLRLGVWFAKSGRAQK